MHLTKIKLAGFKSFVEPTVIPFRSLRTGIVGPNGCGKSNVIDAVRWVMGESSAKQLRGESMADVIFNGTAMRKPLGQASIELFFDNSDASLQGEYAKYNEIAIRREVTRDGFSNYYLNSTKCRRKDIVDIFLGTGLGPRSYAIIEQGMISQLIEAKPDDLRAFLEEAAGISKYKERRRETENRISHTRDNLARLNDIREELEKQLRHLKRQANAANRYKVLKQEQRVLKAELYTLHWLTINNQVGILEAEIKQEELEYQAKQAELTKCIAQIESFRVLQTEANEQYNEVQGRYYKLGAEIGKIEQQIEHNKERHAELNADLLQLDRNWQETREHIDQDRQKSQTLQDELKALEPLASEAKNSVEQAELTQQAALETMHEWQIAWESFTNKAAESAKQAEVEQARISHLEQRIVADKEHLTRLQEESSALNFAELPDEITSITGEYEGIKKQVETAKHELAAKQDNIIKFREEQSELILGLDAKRHEVQKLNGRLASLEALQQVALRKNDQHSKNWLTKNNLIMQPRLVESMQVETGWEKAVEVVMSNYLEAVCVNDFDSAAALLNDFSQGSIALFDINYSAAENVDNNAPTLADKVQSSLPIKQLLGNIFIADDLAAALQKRKTLKAEQSIVTREGVWLGKSWICVHFAEDEKKGVLQRERELKSLQQSIAVAKEGVVKEDELLQSLKQELINLEKSRDQEQHKYNELVEKLGEINSQINVKQDRLTHIKTRAETLQHEIAEYSQRIITTEEQLKEVRAIWAQAEQSKLSDDEGRAAMLAQRTHYKTSLDTASEQAKKAKEKATDLTMRVEFARNQLYFLQQSQDRSAQQIANIKQRREDIVKLIQNAEMPLEGLNKQLEQTLEKRLEVEEELTTAKVRLEKIEYDVREVESLQNKTQKIIQEIREKISQGQINLKALQVRAGTYEEQIAEIDFNLKEVLENLTPEATVDVWEERGQTVARKIDQLGPINLAAIDEYEQHAERKNYLDAQNADLVAALDTLENAIRKIDRETRDRFKNTFEIVNDKFQYLFPVVFGGGNASLILTGDDLLNTGVYIQAQPPGKRNSTIHLLSGGEKALTAIALVFAIFQLNPAPFCMLDEVDAPLDDNNVYRFCNLVKEMSEKTQIIFITHNKITMEIAEQLTGVTMQEPGVSRIVAVDINEAVSMAQT